MYLNKAFTTVFLFTFSAILFAAGNPETVDSVNKDALTYSEKSYSNSYNTQNKKVMVLQINPYKSSFSDRILEKITSVLTKNGWQVTVRDLYKDNFNPTAVPVQQKNDSTDPLVKEYQELLKQSSAVVLIYPLWWKQSPAMLKGWQERVFTYGFAYEYINNSPDSVVGLLPGKRVLIINTTDLSSWYFEENDFLNFLDLSDKFIYGISGMKFSGRHIIYSVPSMSDKEKEKALAELNDLTLLIEPSFWN